MYEVPILPHVGAFGVARKHNFHEGVDIYAAHGTVVFPVEKGEVVAILNFTGESVGSPWWEETQAILIEGETGVVCYGEIDPSTHLTVGSKVTSSTFIGTVKTVLKKDKGRPMSMLHLELYTHGIREWTAWDIEGYRPEHLLDPTPYLLAAETF